jgi:hypothetical protein
MEVRFLHVFTGSTKASSDLNWGKIPKRSPCMGIKKEQILEEIKRTARENGGTPLGKQRFSRETGIKQTDWEGKLWARWGDALREAGFAANELPTAYDEGMLIEKFVLLTRELGRLPVHTELRMKARDEKDFPSHVCLDV